MTKRYNAIRGLLSLLLISQYDTVNGRSKSRTSFGTNSLVSPYAWTPELFQESFLIERDERDKFANKDKVKFTRYWFHKNAPRSTTDYAPFTIETDENGKRSIQKDKSFSQKTNPIKNAKTTQSMVHIIKKHLSSRMVLASEILKKGKDIMSKSTQFALTSAKHRSLGAMLLSDCYALYAQDEDVFFQNSDQHFYLSNGYKVVREKSRHIVNSINVKNFERIRSISPNNRKSGSVNAASGVLTADERNELTKRTEILTENVLHALRDENLWEEVNQEDGVSIWRTLVDVKNYHPVHNPYPDKDSDSATIRSEFILDASPQKVFNLFSDDDRVHEYNENCHKLEDLELISKNCKINWSATGKFGPFSARDFVTLVSFQNLGPKKGYLSLCASVEHPKLAPEKDGYVRSQIQLAATFMEPVEGQPNQTRFTQVMQVGRLGGVADSPLAKRIKKNIQEKAPVEFFHKFKEALKNTPENSHKELNIEA